MEYLSKDGIQVRILESKEDSKSLIPMVWIHGFCESKEKWFEFLKPWNSRNHVLVDLPGMGESHASGIQSVEGFAKIVLSALSEINIQKFHLVGHSLGGYTGLEMLSQNPSKFKSLTLFHSHPFEDLQEKKDGRKKQADFVERNGVLPFLKELMPKLFADPKKFKTTIETLIRRAELFPPKGISDTLLAMAKRKDHSQLLENSNIPFLFIVGGKDHAILKSDSEAQIILPKVAKLAYFEDIGHEGMFEAPNETRKAIIEFINGIERH
jgi:pimeloyl-ACP methyl ester carboxylesterase